MSELVSHIIGMSVSIPKNKMNVEDFGFNKRDVDRRIKLTGIHQVRVSDLNVTASDYCTDAAENLINKLNFNRNDIDGIVFVTPRPDYIFPGNCSVLQKNLNLRKKVVAFDVNSVCTGMIYGLFLANMLIKTEQCKNVLVCFGDTSTKHFNPKDKALKMIVGDGGCAVLLSAGSGDEPLFDFIHDGSLLKNLYIPAGGERIPRKIGTTDVEIEDEEGNVRSLEDQHMNGLGVMQFVLNEIPPLVKNILEKKYWSKDDVDVFVFHQANEFMVKSLTRQMKLDPKKVLLSIDGFGNTGAVSIILALCDLAEKKSINWNKAVLAAFGAGMSGAVMAVDLHKTYFCKIKEF